MHDIKTLSTDQGDFNPECAVVRIRSGTFSAERLLEHLHDSGKQKRFVAVIFADFSNEKMNFLGDGEALHGYGKSNAKGIHPRSTLLCMRVHAHH